MNTEQLAMENTLRHYRATLAENFGLAIQIQARALCTTIIHDGNPYLSAQHILYEIDLVRIDHPGVRQEIFRHVMDATRGVISTLEYTMLGGMVGEQLNLAILGFIRHGVPAELGGGLVGRAAGVGPPSDVHP